MKREIDKLGLSEEDKIGSGLGMKSEEEGLKLTGLEKMPFWWPQALTSYLCRVVPQKVWTCFVLTQETQNKRHRLRVVIMKS